MSVLIKNAWRVVNPGPEMVAEGPVRAPEGPASEANIAKMNDEGFRVLDSYRGMNPSKESGVPPFNRVIASADGTVYLAHLVNKLPNGSEVDLEQ